MLLLSSSTDKIIPLSFLFKISLQSHGFHCSFFYTYMPSCLVLICPSFWLPLCATVRHLLSKRPFSQTSEVACAAFLSSLPSFQQTSVRDAGVGPHSSYFRDLLGIQVKAPAPPSTTEPYIPLWTHARQSPGLKTMQLLKSDTLPLTFFPKPIEDTFLFACSLVFDFSLMTSSSPATSAENFFFFFFLCRGGSFFGKVNIGNITRNIAMAQRRNPLHLKNWEMWVVFMASVWE